MSVELFLSYDEHLDWLTLIEFGQVENAQTPDHWRGVIESFGYLLRHPGGPEIGFKILDFSTFDPEDPEGQGILGHSQITHTMDTYSHITPQHAARSVRPPGAATRVAFSELHRRILF